MGNVLASLKPIALVAAVCGVLLILIGNKASDADSGRTLYLLADDATNVVRGQALRMAGRPVGEVVDVEAVDEGRQARLKVEVDNDRAWPLRRGTTFKLRWGGTVSYLKRYIAITPAAGGDAYRDGDTVAARNFSVPLEFDSLMNAFTADVRRDLRAFVRRGGETFVRARPALRETVQRAPGAVHQAATVLGTLDGTGDRLTALIASTDQVVGAIRAADPSVQQAVSGAGRTLAATAASQQGIRAILERAPETFERIRSTLARADTTLDLAGDTTAKLAPGVSELRRTVGPLNSLLGTAVAVGPTARSTLSTLRTSAPDVTTFLGRTADLLPQVRSIAGQATPQLDCIRAYTPEIVALLSNWGAFTGSSTDGKDFYTRINPAAIPWAPTNVQAQTTPEAFEMFPGMRFGFPRPPGSAAGQSWYQPQCEVTADSEDPRKDREARPGESFTPPPVTARPTRGGGR